MKSIENQGKSRIVKLKSTRKEVVLREYRESISLTQAELGKLVGVDARTISAYERETRKPSLKVAMKIAKVFNTHFENIFPNYD